MEWTGFSRHLEHADGTEPSGSGVAGPLPREHLGAGLQLWLNEDGSCPAANAAEGSLMGAGYTKAMFDKKKIKSYEWLLSY
jgi:hypothetical protein